MRIKNLSKIYIYKPEKKLIKGDYTYTEAKITQFASGTTYYTYNKGEYTAVPSSATFDSEETYYTRA